MAQNNNEFKHHQLDQFLTLVKDRKIPDLFLIHGESFLVKQAFNTLSVFLSGKDNHQFIIETLEGGTVSMGDIIEQVSTFSFLVSKKIVAVKNAPLFQASTSSSDINFSPSDLDRLNGFIEKGLPQNHSLIFTCANIDKRKKIYKTMADKGVIIDCSVAQGAKKTDLDEQRAVAQHIAGQILSKSNKTMENQAFQILVDLTGFNLDLLSQNLDKLIAYSGKTLHISQADVIAVVKRDKKDPIFNLTNAFMAKDVKSALFYLNSLFNDGFHPLQIIKSFENQIRRLILVKCFIQKKYENNPIHFKSMNFNVFKLKVLPKIIDHDKQTKALVEDQDNLFSKNESKKKKNTSNDLYLAPNPQNAYPIFQTFQKSENFSLDELTESLIFFSDLDYQLKSSSFDEKITLEHFIINTCSKGTL